jgi:hypothetical protein
VLGAAFLAVVSLMTPLRSERAADANPPGGEEAAPEAPEEIAEAEPAPAPETESEAETVAETETPAEPAAVAETEAPAEPAAPEPDPEPVDLAAAPADGTASSGTEAAPTAEGEIVANLALSAPGIAEEAPAPAPAPAESARVAILPAALSGADDPATQPPGHNPLLLKTPDPVPPQTVAESAPEPSAAPAAPAEEAAVEPPAAPEGQIAEAPAAPGSGIVPAPEISELPEPAPEAATEVADGIGQPVTTLGDGEAGFGDLATNVRVNRPGEAQAEAPETQAEAADASGLPALERFAAPFANEAAKPLLSIVIVDLGPEAGGLDPGALATFPFPVTFAIPADRSDAAEAARAYREAGFEVAIAPAEIPASAAPADLEVAFGVYLAAIPEAVAWLDVTAEGAALSRAQAAQMAAILGDTGQGLIALDTGINPVRQSAEREGIPLVSVFRILDEDAADADAVRRALDRAILRASQEGSVVALAHSRPDTVSALFAWALEGRAEPVALAPISAAIRAQ